jgi:hypothetical protein
MRRWNGRYDAVSVRIIMKIYNTVPIRIIMKFRYVMMYLRIITKVRYDTVPVRIIMKIYDMVLVRITMKIRYDTVHLRIIMNIRQFPAGWLVVWTHTDVAILLTCTSLKVTSVI